MAKSVSIAEVAKHNTENDCWIIINGEVYDVTSFLDDHPGGRKILLKNAGTDVTEQFKKFHNFEATLKKYGPKFHKGKVEAATEVVQSAEVSPPAEEWKLVDNRDFGFYGELVPYGDPNWYQGHRSLYYTEKHMKVRAAAREFVEREVMPYADEWEENKKIPRELYLKAGEAGFLSAAVASGFNKDDLPPGDWNVKTVGGIPLEEWDGFCSLIVSDELARCGSGGVLWGIMGGLAIGLPPVMKFASQEMKNRVVPDCISGKASICLCITEPAAGSDVGNLTTTATKTADGKHYILNGEKKWITNGVFSDYFTVACRTGGPGMGGVSLLLVEKSMPGVVTKQMNCMGVWSSGTTYVSFEDVKVPVENLIGSENKGFKYIMFNFNYERLGLCISGIRFARVCYEEAFKYACKRKTFGQRLMDHQIIRFKLAEMARQIEATQCQVEHITYQIQEMDQKESFVKLGGATALLKVQVSKVFEYCAREAAQIFGGLSYSRGGQGGKVERLYRDVRAWAIPGGSEEVMLELGIRQQDKVSQKIRQFLDGTLKIKM